MQVLLYTNRMIKNSFNLNTFSQGVSKDNPPPPGITPRPGQIVCGPIDIRIDVSGTWFYLGSPIGRLEIVKLFSSVLKRDKKGGYWLITPAEMCQIQVEDAPFIAIELIFSNQGPNQIIQFRTNIDQIITLDRKHPLRIAINKKTQEPRPYIDLGNGMEARISRPTFYQLVELGSIVSVGQKNKYGVWSKKKFFKISYLE